MPDKWFYVNAKGDTVGPVMAGVLKQLVEQGTVVPSTILVSEDGTKEHLAGEFGSLFPNRASISDDEENRTQSLTPLPLAKTLPLAPKQQVNTQIRSTPSAPEMPIVAAGLFNSGVPLPIVLHSDGQKIIRPKQNRFLESTLIWIIVGSGVVLVLGIFLVDFTWKMAVQHAAKMENRLPKYEEADPVLQAVLEGEVIAKKSGNVPLTPETVAERVEQSIAQINGPVSCGTGFVVAPGVVVTNSHVIASEKIESLEILFPAQEPLQRGPYTPQLLYEDTIRDIALLGIGDNSIPTLPVFGDYVFRRAQRIMTIGNPGRGDGVVLENAVSAGILSTQTVVDGLPFYQLSIAVNQGNSGGPVLDAEGRVIGIISLKSVKRPAMAFCIPAADLEHAVDLEKNLTPKERSDMNTAHLTVVGLQQGLERLGNESVFGSETALVESGQWRGQQNSSSSANSDMNSDNVESIQELELPQMSEADREQLGDQQFESRYQKVLAKEKWTFNGTPLHGRIVGFKNGIVMIRLKGAADDEPPIERYARRFSAADINDILFYARYNKIPTGNLSRR